MHTWMHHSKTTEHQDKEKRNLQSFTEQVGGKKLTGLKEH